MTCKCYHAEKNFLGEIGVCWGTKERDACSCGGDEAKCSFYEYVRERARKAVTNGDRVRAKTDEELARWLVLVEQRVLERNPMLERPALYEDWLDWLRKEVDADA